MNDIDHDVPKRQIPGKNEAPRGGTRSIFVDARHHTAQTGPDQGDLLRSPGKVTRMFRRLGPGKDTLADISRVEVLVRERFRIPDSDIILVSQDPGTKPGFPPIETNAIFWKDEIRYRLKIFSPVADVMGADLPVAWLLPSLEDTGEGECC